MRRLAVAVVLALLAVPAFSAIQYEFTQRNTSDDSVSPASDLTARATIDGQSSRIDFIGGTLYPPGTYVISTDGSHRLYFVDPAKQWYTEFNASSVATSLGASTIRIENRKSEFEALTDKAVIAGIEADHYRLTISYDISVNTKGGLPLKQNVRTEIESWTTTRFGDILAGAASTITHTGNAELDQLLNTETARLKGFPLRQIVTTKTTLNLPPVRSELKVPQTRTIVRETWVTKVSDVAAQPGLYSIPASYRRADTPDAPKAATEVLAFDPPAQ